MVGDGPGELWGWKGLLIDPDGSVLMDAKAKQCTRPCVGPIKQWMANH